MNLRNLTLSLLLLIVLSCKKEEPAPVQVATVVPLGAILDLTGDYSEEGIAGQAAIELAVSDLNQRYASVGSPVRFSCLIADTHLDTSLTITAAREMYDRGIRLLVAGPNNSAGLKVIKPFLDQNQMLVLNCFSTAPSLAIPDDFIFRLITDDNVQGQALIRMMQYDSISTLIPVWREDTYGTGLYQTVKQRLLTQGGIMMPGVSYQPGATNFDEMIRQLEPQVTNAIATYGAKRVAVIVISYQEAADFLKSASVVHILSTVKWYGCDANIQKTSISSDPAAAAFAHTVRFLGPIMGIGTAGNLPERAQQLSDQIMAKTGSNPTAYALTVYDAVQIYGLSYDIVQSNNGTLVKTVIPSVCEAYNYLGISRKLNPAGDLANANYIFWTVVPNAQGYTWASYATYMAEGDYILLR